MDSSIQSLDDHEVEEEVISSETRNKNIETVGDYLKQMREAKGLCLAEIAQLTKISEHYLKCIEKDDFEIIPKGPYVKGYISNYARMIGGDNEKALGLYSDLNEEKETIDETLPETPLAVGWKASLTTMLFSVCDWVKERKKGCTAILPNAMSAPNRSQTPSSVLETPPVLEIKKSPVDVAQETEKEHLPVDENKKNGVSSVLIPFKRMASPSAQPNAPAKIQASTETPVQTLVDPPEEIPSKSSVPKTIDPKAAILAFYRKLAKGLGRASSWIKANRLKPTTIKINWPPIPRSFWATLVGVVAGVLLIVFCAIGVYHVFFFNSQGLEAIVANDTSDKQEAAALAMHPPQVQVEHKTTRFKKPETSSLPATAAVLPSAEPMQHQTEATPKAAPLPTIAQVDKPAQPEPLKSATTAPVKSDKAKPAETRIRVLKATICSAIKDKYPADSKNAFPLSVDRVYVWSHIEAKQYPTAIRHIYYHEGQMINQVELPVRALLWRTWSFKSIDKDHYRGHWRVDITTADSGKVLRRLYFEIK